MSDNDKNTSSPQVDQNSLHELNHHNLTDTWMLQARRASQVPLKQQVSLRIDEDILDFFKQQGSRYQTKMHAVLRAYVDGCTVDNKK